MYCFVVPCTCRLYYEMPETKQVAEGTISDLIYELYGIAINLAVSEK